MADLKPFAGMSQEETNFQILAALIAILDKLPRVDTNDRVIVNNSEVTSTVNISSAQTLATVTTVSDITRLQAFGANSTTSKPADALPLHVSNIGAAHIYDNIKVT